MSGHKLLIAAGPLAAAEPLGEFLQELPEPAADAVALFECANGDWTIEAYYPRKPDVTALGAAIAAFTGVTTKVKDGSETDGQPGGRDGHEDGRDDASTGSGRPVTIKVSCQPIADENWVALSQAGLPPVSAGRFCVHGSHDRARISVRQNAIEIDAGEAFGTAHHETTQGCLLAIDQLARLLSFRRVLDLGCGSAVLAIAAARAMPGTAHIIASDIDARATEVARRNIQINGAARRIEVLTATGFQQPRLQRPQSFDLIIANILAAPLIELAKDMARAAKPWGVAVLSGLLSAQAGEVAACYRAAGFFIVDHKRLGEWSTLTLQRRPRR